MLHVNQTLGLVHRQHQHHLFVPFKNGFNTVLRCYSHITLKRSKVPLTETGTLTVHVNEAQGATCSMKTFHFPTRQTKCCYGFGFPLPEVNWRKLHRASRRLDNQEDWTKRTSCDIEHENWAKIGESLTIILESCTFGGNSFMCTCEVSEIQSNCAIFLFKIDISSMKKHKEILPNCTRLFGNSWSLSQLVLSVLPPLLHNRICNANIVTAVWTTFMLNTEILILHWLHVYHAQYYTHICHTLFAVYFSLIVVN